MIGQGYKVKSEEQKIEAFQNRYSEPKICKNPECGNEFRVCIAYWVGKVLVKHGSNPNLKRYCSPECAQQARRKYRRKQPDKELYDLD